DEVVLIAAGCRYEYSSALRARQFQHVVCGAVANEDRTAQLVHQRRASGAVAFDDRNFVPGFVQLAGEIHPDLAASRDQDVAKVIGRVVMRSSMPGRRFYRCSRLESRLTGGDVHLLDNVLDRKQSRTDDDELRIFLYRFGVGRLVDPGDRYGYSIMSSSYLSRHQVDVVVKGDRQQHI